MNKHVIPKPQARKLDKKVHQIVIAVDFDGVIHDYKHPLEGRRMGAPIEGAKDTIEQWLKQGKQVIVHSVWAGDTIRDWLKYYEFPVMEVTNVKPQADYYLDDKAIRFTSWDEANHLIG